MKADVGSGAIMELEDDRTDEERETHTVIVMMTDTFMSGWGEAKGGVSYAGWACLPEHQERVEEWVRSRSDADNVRVMSAGWNPDGDYEPPSIIGHCHIDVVGPNHMALRQEENG